MRKIMFRGKSVRTDNWFFGDLVWYSGDEIPEIQGFDEQDQWQSIEVESETIGQYTGLKDRSGKEIYEDDVVNWAKDCKNYVVTFRDGMFYANVEHCNEGVYGGYPLWILCAESQCEIVGNIFDNKDLLKK